MNSQGDTSNSSADDASTGDAGTGNTATDRDGTDRTDGTDGTTGGESGVSESAASLVRAIEDRLGIKNSGGDEAFEAPELAERPEVAVPELPGAEYALPDVETPDDEIHLDQDVDLTSELNLDHQIPDDQIPDDQISDDDPPLDEHRSPIIDAPPATESAELIGDDPTTPLATAATATAATGAAKTARAPWTTTQRRPVRSQPILAPVAKPRSTRRASGIGVATATLAPFLAAALGLFVWWLVTRSDDPIVGSSSWPGPGDTWDAFRDLQGEPSFREVISATLTRFAIALAGGIVAGLGIGWLLGRFPLARNLLRPLTSGLRLLAPPLLIPFYFLWFDEGSVAVALPAFVGVLGSIVWSMSNTIDDRQRNLAFNIAERSILTLRNGAMVAWPLIYIAEMLGSEEGVAASLLASADGGDLSQAVVWLAVALVLAVVVDVVLRLVQFLSARRARRELV
jgi:NitT/TauT family transport system permease protein